MAARDKLNARQRIFVREYVWGAFAGDRAECLKLAGYKLGDATSAAYQLLRKPAVRALYENELAEKEELVKLRALGWVEHLEKLLTVDPKDLADEDGNPLPVSKMPENARRALAGVDIEELWEGRGEDRQQVGVVRKYRLHDKKGVTELLLKWAGKLKDKVEVEGKLSLADLVLAASRDDDDDK